MMVDLMVNWRVDWTVDWTFDWAGDWTLPYTTDTIFPGSVLHCAVCTPFVLTGFQLPQGNKEKYYMSVPRLEVVLVGCVQFKSLLIKT